MKTNRVPSYYPKGNKITVSKFFGRDKKEWDFSFIGEDFEYDMENTAFARIVIDALEEGEELKEELERYKNQDKSLSKEEKE